MTRDPSREDWDDARIEAAFEAWAAKAPRTPADLAQAVSDRLTSQRRREHPWLWWAAAAAVVSVALVTGGTQLLQTPLPSAATPPAASSRNTTSVPPSAQPTPDTRVIDALGDPITITEALAVQRAPTDRDREMLISGYLSPVPTIYCAIQYGPRNPTRPRCPDDYRRFTEDAEAFTAEPPTSPWLAPSFALVKGPDVPWPDDGGPAIPKPVVLLGHFHDRRAALCPENRPLEQCAETFVVDRVVSLDGVEQPIETRRGTDALPLEQSSGVDALVTDAAPGSVLASRQLLPLMTAFDAEPALRTDETLENWSPASQLTWLETVIDLRDGAPVARTFVLLDGTSWFAEVTSGGAQLRERTVQPPSPSAWPAMPTGDPAAFASAPTSVLGIPVRSIGAIQADRQSSMDSLGRDEMAVRAWYVGPAPGASCPASSLRVPPPGPPCDAGRHWLLDDPQQLGLYTGQLSADPRIDRWAPILNPIVPADVPFDPGVTWHDDRPVPVPVIVLGHFSDNRVRTYAGNLYFVIDALAWKRDGAAGSLNTEARLTPNATEAASSVLARIDAVSQNVAVATWATVIDAADFVAFDPNFEQSTEFGSGSPVWIVRRLVQGEMDGRRRLAIEWAWTHDGGTRVWLTETPDSAPDLASTLDIPDLDDNSDLVRVVDYDDAITFVAPATGLESLHWQQPLGNATEFMDIARGSTSRELVVRWSGPSCAATWRVEVRVAADGHVFLSPSTREWECEGSTVTRRIVIGFGRPIDIDKVEGPSCCG